MRRDWTERGGRANSSAEFVALAQHVAGVIRGCAHDLINGNVDGVGRLIVAQLAHKFGMSPPSSRDKAARGRRR